MSGLESSAFRDFALGKFQNGLAVLGKCESWGDPRTDLDGPFCLRFGSARGYGEQLLLASLLKRELSDCGNQAEVFVHPNLCSLLSSDPCFIGKPDDDLGSAGRARKPIAILKAALSGNLLSKKFAPLCIDKNTPAQPREKKRVGIAWASVSGDKPIPGKSICLRDFKQIFAGMDFDIVSFQRHLSIATSEASLDDLFDRRIEVVGTDEIDGDQLPVATRISELDCMVTISTTTAHLAASLGVPVVLITKHRSHQQWFWVVQKIHNKLLYPTVDVVLCEATDDHRQWWAKGIGPARRSLQRVLRPS